MTLEFAQSKSIGSTMMCLHYSFVGQGWLDNLKEYVASKKLQRDNDRRLGLVENLRQQLVETLHSRGHSPQYNSGWKARIIHTSNIALNREDIASPSINHLLLH